MKPAHLAFVALAVLAGTAGYITHQIGVRARAQAAATALAEPAPPSAAAVSPLEWSFSTPDGGSAPLSTWRGQVLVLNFWATWCPPCLHEIPGFIDLQRRHGGRGLQFVGIALDQAEAVRPFIVEKGLNYPVLLGDEDVARFMLSLGNDIGALPYTVVLGRDGKVALTHRGEWDTSEAEVALMALLKSG